MARQDLSPRDAKERYLNHRRTDARESSIDSWHYRLKHFVQWAEEQDIQSMGEVDGFTLDTYETFRRGQGVSAVYLNGEMQTIKNWLEYLARIEVVDEDLPEKCNVPPIPEGEESNDEFLSADRAREIIAQFRSYPQWRATQQHVAFELLWFTAARVGAIQALDLRDFNAEERYLEFHHRPETDTPLKNGEDGERAVALQTETVDIITEYVGQYRERVHDDYGREPLITTQSGRPAENTMRVWSYRATQPCIHMDCPHGHERETCEYVDYHQASKCPSSMSPHRIRTGSITWHRDCGWPAEKLSERVNASLEVIERYYDQASARERMEQRRRPLVDKLDFEHTTEDSES